ncbi:hypothetical protein ETD83_35115 [Actinomadura soli]|uniref:Bacterial proteasome activator n=1 Tax=Actinomadura soli TaxID=2508997 RepID=A0A5C4J1D6_9ACTN|nr:hypothetical protein [Actinomadura soli]TMQ90518.1 hypothetical protein ETD83_35115 [Actinomadura soli]
MIARHQPPDRHDPAAPTPRPAQMTIPIGDGREARQGYEVTAPTRLLRTWRLLSAMNEELHAAGADTAGAHRAAMMFNVLRDELIRSVSQPLAAEVRELLPPLDEHCGVAGTRTACAAALAWLDSLIAAMLLQSAQQGERPAGRKHPTKP